MALLDGLDKVGWDRLSHAYGPATDVPDLLRALVFPDRATLRAPKGKTVREHVMWTLWGNVFHQGTVWQVTPHVIPFLVEILRDGPADPDLQTFVVEYLHHLALGYPSDMFPVLVDPETYFVGSEGADEVDSDGADDEHSNLRMVGYARDCFDAVEAARATVAPLVRSPHDQVALAAIALLGSFRGEGSAVPLRQVIEDGVAARQAIALVALAQLDPVTTQREAMKCLADQDRYIAVHAAAALLLADPAQVPPAALDVLTRPLDELTERASPLTGTVGTLVGRCLARLSGEHVERVVAAIGASLATSKPMTNLAVTGSLLQLVFPDGAPAKAEALTSTQRRALDAIASHGAFEVGNGLFGNYALLLGDWGLPSERSKLKAWLAVSSR